MPAYSEEEMIAGCRKKNRALQEHVYKTYYSTFLKVCARYARSMEDAEQLLNDGFLKVFTLVGAYNNTGTFAGWMSRVMVNTCIDYLRGSALKNEIKMHIKSVPAEESDLAVSNEGLDSVEFKDLLNMIQILPVITRTAFNLYVFDGYNHKEIAEILDISEGTSHWHVHQARVALQKKIMNNDQNKTVYEAKRI